MHGRGGDQERCGFRSVVVEDRDDRAQDCGCGYGSWVEILVGQADAGAGDGDRQESRYCGYCGPVGFGLWEAAAGYGETGG